MTAKRKIVVMGGSLDRIVLLPQPEGTDGISSSKVRERMLAGESSRELLCPGVWELFKVFTAADFPDVINRFSKEYAFLANTFKCPLVWQGRHFKCARDAYAFSKQGRILINGNNKEETWWGVDLDSWKGKNHLGSILMEIRDKEEQP